MSWANLSSVSRKTMGGAELIRVSELSDAAQYAYAATPRPGTRLLFLAGACPIDTDGQTVAPTDVRAQTRLCLENLETALRACGAQLADLVQTRVLVATTSQEALRAAWEAYREALAPHDPPSTLMGVTVLGYDDQLVEIEAVAAIPSPAT